MIDYFERSRFIDRFGTPILETEDYRFYYSRNTLKVYHKNDQRWSEGYECEYGDFHMYAFLQDHEREELKELIAEAILLEE